MASPLSNIRVLDMSRILAGPWAGQLLGDYGADVVKIERPGSGDDTRSWGPPWLDESDCADSAYFLSTNRNKRSITVDIAVDEGQQLIRDLAQHADILIENFKAGTMRRYGLGPDALRRLNPGLIYCRISAFGTGSSRADEPGYDAMIQATAGLMSITGPAASADDAGGPQKVGVAIADLMAGLYACTGVLAALNSRAATGKGQFIDVPLYDSQVACLANQNMNYLVGGIVPGRMGTAHPNLVPYQSFTTSNGDFMLAVGNDRQFAACADCVGQPELASDARFARNHDRVANRVELVRILGKAFQSETTEHWLEIFGNCGVPAGPINDIEEVLTNEFARERELVRHMTNSGGRDVPTVSNPVRFSATPVSYERAAPSLGEHTDEVLREWLGYSAESIARLRQKSAI